MKKTIFGILLLLVCALLLTGCYQNRDPWPPSESYAGRETDVTLPPRTTITPEPLTFAAPTSTPIPAAPTVEPMVNLWDVEPTALPGGSMNPGFNG